MVRVNVWSAHSGTMWSRGARWRMSLADVAGQYLKKGAEIAIEGRRAYRTYEDGEGHTRYVTEIVASEMLMLDRRPVESVES